MRKITETMVDTLFNRGTKTQSNTCVETIREPHTITSYMHYQGNKIARIEGRDKLFITNCGWETNTTKERLNGILSRLGYRIYQKDFVWYIEGNELEDALIFDDTYNHMQKAIIIPEHFTND